MTDDIALRARIAEDLAALDPAGRGAYRRELARLMECAREDRGRGEARRVAAAASALALWALAVAVALVGLAGLSGLAMAAALLASGAAALAGGESWRAAQGRRRGEQAAGVMALELHIAALAGSAQRRGSLLAYA